MGSSCSHKTFPAQLVQQSNSMSIHFLPNSLGNLGNFKAEDKDDAVGWDRTCGIGSDGMEWEDGGDN